MSESHTPLALMAKADQAVTSAAVLLGIGDVDGTCNRAYYAMFDADRAALLAAGAPLAPDLGRTHSGLIGAFGLHLVKTDRVPKSWGRMLNRALEVRQVADYQADSVALADARELLNQAQAFVAEMRQRFIGSPPTA